MTDGHRPDTGTRTPRSAYPHGPGRQRTGPHGTGPHDPGTATADDAGSLGEKRTADEKESMR